eukprot:Nitzschia sp. Nitz4//scaffold40_size135432//80866//82002//NITZ4_003252-RA/size135432-processed-gene-0.44-mRNA-1//1//CDS//3329551243//8521//frame0
MTSPDTAPLTLDEMSKYRAKASAALEKLDQQIDDTPDQATPPSWVHPESDSSEPIKKRSFECRYFDTYGFYVAKQFADDATVAALKQQMADLAEADWKPDAELDTFGTDTKSNAQRGDYFLDSSNKVHYFAEPTALEGGKLKREYQRDKLAALNKAGHGMHTIPGAFREYAMSNKMREFVTGMGWKQPVIPQSMYIFKQPKIGGTVTSHQDSTFLFTEPRQTCMGLWLALDDATMENGCLWVRPGSHREPLRRQFLRNPHYFAQDEPFPQTEDDPKIPKLIFRDHHQDSNMTWEGGLPADLTDAGFVPVEVKAGDLVTFCGTLDHLSLPNFSDLQRHTFQLHLVEGPDQGIIWSPENWLQYPDGIPFVDLVKGKQKAC